MPYTLRTICCCCNPCLSRLPSGSYWYNSHVVTAVLARVVATPPEVVISPVRSALVIEVAPLNLVGVARCRGAGCGDGASTPTSRRIGVGSGGNLSGVVVRRLGGRGGAICQGCCNGSCARSYLHNSIRSSSGLKLGKSILVAII